MEAQDLRIGNLVYHNGEIHETKGATIVYQKSTYKCEPIPLTEEWLLKFGFEKETDDYWGTSNCDECFIYEAKEKCYTGYINYVKLNYVHQLQNLIFALTGTELEIK